MSDYEVGYCKPPKHTRFQKGICPNPKGRGKREANPLEAAVDAILNTNVSYRDGGKLKRATRAELSIKRLIAAALQGDVKAAAQLLSLHKHAERTDTAPILIRILGGLPQDLLEDLEATKP